MCHAVYQYANANNKYMRDYNQNRIIITDALECKLYIWMGNNVKITC